MSTSKPASPVIASQQAALRSSLPFSDTHDFEDAARGLVATLPGATGPLRRMGR